VNREIDITSCTDTHERFLDLATGNIRTGNLRDAEPEVERINLRREPAHVLSEQELSDCYIKPAVEAIKQTIEMKFAGPTDDDFTKIVHAKVVPVNK